VKIGGKIRYRPDGTPLPQIAKPVFGYKSHISIDQRFGFIRKATVTSAADSDGRQLRRVVDTSNTASDVWADSAYRSSKNEVICPLLSGPIFILGLATKEGWNGKEAQAGGDHRQAGHLEKPLVRSGLS